MAKPLQPECPNCRSATIAIRDEVSPDWQVVCRACGVAGPRASCANGARIHYVAFISKLRNPGSYKSFPDYRAADAGRRLDEALNKFERARGHG